jgi:hypothetical protein
MRKALIGLIMAATAATPIAAQAAPNERTRGSHRVEQLEDRAQERSERRAQRQQQRQERQVVQADRPNREQRRVERRGDRQQSRGDRRDNRGERRPVVTQAPNVVVRDYPNGVRRFTTREDYREERRERRDWRQDRRDDRRDWRDDRRSERRWNRNWRNDRRYDWQRYRWANRHFFNRGRYYAPYRGHSYSRLSIGLLLGAPFYSSNYWISDPWQYRLPAAYPGTRWVRYYNDVLLVDTYTGEVLDVIHDFFW